MIREEEAQVKTKEALHIAILGTATFFCFHSPLTFLPQDAEAVARPSPLESVKQSGQHVAIKQRQAMIAQRFANHLHDTRTASVESGRVGGKFLGQPLRRSSRFDERSWESTAATDGRDEQYVLADNIGVVQARR